MKPNDGDFYPLSMNIDKLRWHGEPAKMIKQNSRLLQDHFEIHIPSASRQTQTLSIRRCGGTGSPPHSFLLWERAPFPLPLHLRSLPVGWRGYSEGNIRVGGSVQEVDLGEEGRAVVVLCIILCVCCSLLGVPPSPSFVCVPTSAPPPYSVVAPSFPGSAPLPPLATQSPPPLPAPPVRAVDDDVWVSARRRAALFSLLPRTRRSAPSSPLPTRDPAVDEGRRSSARRRAVLARSTSRTLAVPPFVCVAPRTHRSPSVNSYERRRKSPPPARSRSQCAGRARARLVPVMEGGPILLKPPLPARAPQSTRRRVGRARGVRVASSLLPHSFIHPPAPILVREQLPKAARSSLNRPSRSRPRD
ncbi:hypothetical protein B0H13DRAFT_1028561 [Mycena leptocephala]|nr:hypothetical protein B0H13DRAFT_1028561 [Mycena leptocephala]